MSSQNPIDRAHRLMRTLGWSFCDILLVEDGCPVWQVYSTRDADKIIARAHSQAEAWDEALRQAGIVQRS